MNLRLSYLLYRNESLAGNTPGEDIEDRTKLDEFTAKTYGMRLGGPIIKKQTVLLYER